MKIPCTYQSSFLTRNHPSLCPNPKYTNSLSNKHTKRRRKIEPNLSLSFLHCNPHSHQFLEISKFQFPIVKGKTISLTPLFFPKKKKISH